MTSTAFLFYLANVAIVAGCLFGLLVFVTRRSVGTRALARRAWMAAIVVFVALGVTHGMLGIYAAIEKRVFGDDGSVGWLLLAVFATQAVGLWTFVVALRSDVYPTADQLDRLASMRRMRRPVVTEQQRADIAEVVAVKPVENQAHAIDVILIAPIREEPDE